MDCFIKTAHLGSRFRAEQLVEEKPEMDMVKIQGDCLQIVAVNGIIVMPRLKALVHQINMSI